MADSDSPSLILEEFLPYRLSVLSNRISGAIADSYEKRFNMSLPEWRVMAIIGQTPDISAGEVSERSAMDKVAVSRAVNRLLKSGRLARHFSNEDRRRSVLSLTDAGQEVYRQIIPLAKSYERAILEQLSDEDGKVLDRLLKTLAALRVSGPGSPDSLK